MNLQILDVFEGQLGVAEAGHNGSKAPRVSLRRPVVHIPSAYKTVESRKTVTSHKTVKTSHIPDGQVTHTIVTAAYVVQSVTYCLRIRHSSHTRQSKSGHIYDNHATYKTVTAPHVRLCRAVVHVLSVCKIVLLYVRQ